VEASLKWMGRLRSADFFGQPASGNPTNPSPAAQQRYRTNCHAHG
jgi:hypothetical protein